MTIEEVITVLAMQEEILQFGHFTNEDAWALGNIIVAEARKRGLDTAVEIRLNNGYTVFKYAGNSTNLNNESWMTKMYNTVRRMEKSTMLLYSEMKKSEETLEDIGLNTGEYSCMGGGFPIRIEEVGVIGVILGGAGTYLAMKSGDSENDGDISYLPESSYSEDSNTEE